jgi:hypothetical protein
MRGRVYWGLLAAALLVRCVFLFWGFVSDDVYRYVWEGEIQWEGLNPYAVAPADSPPALQRPDHEQINHADLPTIYPPLAQYFFAAMVKIGLEERGMRNAVLVLDMALCVLLLEWLRRSGRPLLWSAFYLLHPVAILSVATGHIEPLMLLGLVGCAWAREERRDRLAALFLALAILSKVVAVLALPWFLLRRPRETLLVTLPVVALAYVPFLDADVTGTLVRFGSDFAFNASIYRVAEWMVAGHGRAVVDVLLVGWIGFVTVTQPRLPSALVMLFAGLLLLSPTVHSWYLGWFLVLLPAVGPRPWTWPLFAWSVSVLLVGRTYVSYYFFEGEFREYFGITILEYLVPLAASVFVFARYRPRGRPVTAPGSGASGSFGVVIPCRGERRNLAEALPRWLDTPVEMIIVADTPTGDGTGELCRMDLRVRYLPVHERGYGAAVQAGLEKLRDEVEFAVVCDADHPTGPRQVEALLAPFADPDVGLVSGDRGKTAHLTPAQKSGNALACALIALGWGRRFRDLGPFRALRFTHWPRGMLRDKGFGWNVEMSVRALELGMECVEVDLPAAERPHGENQITGTFRGVVGAGWGILSKLYALREESCGPP